jgi:hypothetical protein
MEIHYHICGIPAAPVLGQTPGGSLPATTYYVKVTGVNSTAVPGCQSGETLPSAEVSFAVAAGNLLTVSLPPPQPDLTGNNVYVGTASGAETLQNSPALAQGSTWTEPASGLVPGTAVPTTTTVGSKAQDFNQWLGATFNANNGFPGGLSPFYIRAWFYFKAPEADDTSNSLGGGTMRKLFYPMDVPPPAHWLTTLVSFYSGGTINLCPACCGTQWYHVAALNFNTWYEIEFAVVPNTPGLSDGSMALWVNGAQVWQMKGLNIRGSYTDGVGWVEVGDQAQRFGYYALDEYRYLDDVAIGTSYIP